MDLRKAYLQLHMHKPMAFSDSNVDETEVLPHAIWIWLECCADDNVIHYELGDLKGYSKTMGHTVIH